MEEKNIDIIIDRYLKGIATQDEVAWLERYYRDFPGLTPPYKEADVEQIISKKNKQWQEIRSKIQKDQPGRYPFSSKILRVAAVLLILFSLGGIGFFYFSNHPVNSSAHLSQDNATANNIYQASLKFPNGNIVLLDSAYQEIYLGTDSHLYYPDGALVVPESFSQESGFMELATLKQRQYSIKLQDGSKIALNAGSSIRFPLNFNNDQRDVYLSGEAFFSIEKLHQSGGRHIPFVVHSKNQHIKVLGTKFNVTAYAHENSEIVTLVEGKVEVTGRTIAGTKKVLLSPHEQSIYKSEGLQKTRVNVKNEVEWVEGNFVFEDEYLAHILTKIARWYNVEFDYRVDVSKIKLFGIIPRHNTLPTTLENLEKTSGLKFKMIEGRVIVME